MVDIEELIDRLEHRLAAAEAERDAAVVESERLRLQQSIDEALLDAIASHEGIHRFETELASLLGKPAFVIDALDPRRPDADIVGIERILAGPHGADVVVCTAADGRELALVPAVVQSRALGAVACPGPADDVTRLVLSRAARALAALLSFQRALSEAAARENHELLTTLIAGRPLAELPILAQRVRALGIDLGERLALAIVTPIAAQPGRALQVLAARTSLPLIGAVHDGHACIVANGDEPEDLARSWSRLLASRGMNATVAVEPVTTHRPQTRAAQTRELAAIPSAHESALRITRAALQLRRAGEGVTRATLGVASLVLGDEDASTADSIVRVTVGDLIAYDERHRTDLANTARTYLDANQRVTTTAAALHLHENTVRQRIARIDQILGRRWRRGPNALDTHLALRLHQLTVSDRHMI